MKPLSLKVLHRTKRIWAKLNDIYLGIETGYESGASFASSDAKHQDGAVYQAVDYLNIRRILRSLRPARNDVFYDIGCGKGRVLCCSARWPMKMVVGVDLSPALCSEALRNTEHMRWRRTPVQVRCDDAAVADISDGTIYFMFNPFGAATLKDFLNNIHSSLIGNPRRVVIVYCNPVHASEVDSCDWLSRSGGLRTLSGGKIFFWDNQGG